MEHGEIAAVIPSYRVAAQIADVIRAVPRQIRHIIVIDDCCPEDSASVALAVNDPRVTVIRHPQNRGVGGAMKTGFAHALELEAEFVIKIDGDGQMDPALAATLLEPLLSGRAAFSKGNRFWHLRELSAMPVRRRVGNIGLSFL